MTPCMCCGAAYFTGGTAWDACGDCIADRLQMLLLVSAGVGKKLLHRAELDPDAADGQAERGQSLPHRRAG